MQSAYRSRSRLALAAAAELVITLALGTSARAAITAPDVEVPPTYGDIAKKWMTEKVIDAGKAWMFDHDVSPTMRNIIALAAVRADGDGAGSNANCRGAVMGITSTVLHDLDYKYTAEDATETAFDTLSKLVELASGFGEAAAGGETLDWLAEQYAAGTKPEPKNRIFAMYERAQAPIFEAFEKDGTLGDGPCTWNLSITWNKPAGIYSVYVAGDCQCSIRGNVGAMARGLGKWWLKMEGRVYLKVNSDDHTAAYVVAAPTFLDSDAQCGCGNRELRDPFPVPHPAGTAARPGGTPATPGGAVSPPPPASSSTPSTAATSFAG